MFTYIDFSFYQILLSLIIVISSILILNIIGAKNKKDLIYITVIYIWHTLFAFLYYMSTIPEGDADSNMYYRTAYTGYNIQLEFGTHFIRYLTSWIIRLTDSSYLNATLIYNLIGSLGLVLFYLSLKKFLKSLPWYWGLILFLPSISYWSSAIGKDAVSFLSICTLVYAVTTANRKTPLYIISIFLMLMVRPHVAFMIVASYVFYFIVQSKVHLVFKLTALPILTIGALILLNLTTEYVGIDETSTSGVVDYYDSTQGANNKGGGGIDTSSMSLPVKLFSYMFRPLPFEAHSAITLIASIENSILLLTFIFLMYTSKSKLKLLVVDKRLWLTTYIIFTSIMLSYGLSNLGIAARQKWMFMPILIYLLIETYYYNKIKKSETVL